MSTQLSKDNYELDVWDVLVTQAVVGQGVSWEDISSNGNA